MSSTSKQGRVRQHKARILREFSPEDTNGHTYQFRVDGQLLENREYCEHLKRQLPKLQDINTRYMQQCVATVVQEKHGGIRDSEVRKAQISETYVSKHEVDIGHDRLLTIHVRSTDLYPTIIRVTELQQAVVYDQEAD